MLLLLIKCYPENHSFLHNSSRKNSETLLPKTYKLKKMNKSSEPLQAVARCSFNGMDLDHNGSLDYQDLHLMLRTLGVDDKEISLLVASVDLDKD